MASGEVTRSGGAAGRRGLGRPAHPSGGCDERGFGCAAQIVVTKPEQQLGVAQPRTGTDAIGGPFTSARPWEPLGHSRGDQRARYRGRRGEVDLAVQVDAPKLLVTAINVRAVHPPIAGEVPVGSGEDSRP